MAGRTNARSWGRVRKLPSGRWQASYLAPNGQTYTARTEADKPLTFATRGDADAWLNKVRNTVDAGTWTDPDAPAPEAPETFQQYATRWLAERRLKGGEPLAQRTTEGIADRLRLHVFPEFGSGTVQDVTAAAVRTWHARELPKVGKRDGATVRAHSYADLKAICATAVLDGLLPSNPCRVTGASSTDTAKDINPMSSEELVALAAAMPARLAAAPIVLAYGSLRFGELAGLRRKHIDLDAATIRIEQAVVRTKAGKVFKAPKSKAGKRTVAIPSRVMPQLRDHLDRHVDDDPEAIVFSGAFGGVLASSSFGRIFGKAAASIGRPDVTPHGCRHAGQTLAAKSGATLKELMQRAGQSTPKAALLYLHSTAERQREIAESMA